MQGAKNAASGIRSRGKNLIKKIKNEGAEDDPALEHEDENSALMEKRRRLFQKLKGADGEDLAADSADGNTAADTNASVEWERMFVKRARRKRTCISAAVGLLVFSLVFVPPLVVYMKDAACDAPSLSEAVPFRLNVLEELYHIDVETFRGNVQIISDANLTQVDRIVVDITKRSVSADSMSGISASASISARTLKVLARYDEQTGGSFGLSTCPQADIVIRVPLLSQSSPSSGPTLNVTVDGQIGEPVFYPWVPNLVKPIGEIDLSLSPAPASVVFSSTLLHNTIGSISVKVSPPSLAFGSWCEDTVTLNCLLTMNTLALFTQRFKGTHLSAVASNGTVSIESSTLSTVRVVTHSGDIAVRTTELSRMDEITMQQGIGTGFVCDAFSQPSLVLSASMNALVA